MGSTQEEDRKLCVVNRKCTATFKWKHFLYEHRKRERKKQELDLTSDIHPAPSRWWRCDRKVSVCTEIPSLVIN